MYPDGSKTWPVKKAENVVSPMSPDVAGRAFSAELGILKG